MSAAVESRFRAVEKLVTAAQNKQLDEEIAAYYCKLGCVMICGAVERSVEIIIIEKLNHRTTPQVISFLRSFFKRGTNYSCDEILDLLYKFDSDWGNRFKEFIAKNEKVKSGMSSCYATRNAIAHGGTQSLGPSILKQYYNDALTLVTNLELVLRG